MCASAPGGVDASCCGHCRVKPDASENTRPPSSLFSVHAVVLRFNSRSTLGQRAHIAVTAKLLLRTGTSCTSAAHSNITNVKLYSLFRHSLLHVSWNAGACNALIACTPHPPSQSIQWCCPLLPHPPVAGQHTIIESLLARRTRSTHISCSRSGVLLHRLAWAGRLGAHYYGPVDYYA